MSLPAGARSGCGAWPWAVAACRECRDWAPPGASSPAQARGGLPGGEGQGAGGGQPLLLTLTLTLTRCSYGFTPSPPPQGPFPGLS